MVRRDHIMRNVMFLTELDRYTFFSCRQSIIMNLYGKIYFVLIYETVRLKL